MVIGAFPPSDDGSSPNQRVDWWNRPVQGLDYAEYKIDEFSKVLVGTRPNYHGTTPNFYNAIDGWINVSDRFVRHEKGKLNVFLPWNEGGTPTYETIFSVLKTMHYWIDEQRVSQVYIHCDGGTHRAVTLFGFYLLAYHPERAQEINANYKLVGREVWSNPLEYANSYFDDIPLIKDFLAALKESKDAVNHGHSIEDFLKELQKPELLKAYYRQRLFTKDLPYMWMMIKLNVKFWINQQTLGRWHKMIRWGHKKLNTKTGQQLKKMGL